MRVLCIDGSSEPGWAENDLIEGDIYTVTDSHTDEQGDLWYKLMEADPRGWYEAKYLIPISGISETEMERNYNQVLITK